MRMRGIHVGEFLITRTVNNESWQSKTVLLQVGRYGRPRCTPWRLRSTISAVSEDELKREAGEFDLEAITFLDLSDRGDWATTSDHHSYFLQRIPHLATSNFLHTLLSHFSKYRMLFESLLIHLQRTCTHDCLLPVPAAGLTQLGAVPLCHSLKVLNLSCNQLSSVGELHVLVVLEELDISANQITALGMVLHNTTHHLSTCLSLPLPLLLCQQMGLSSWRCYRGWTSLETTYHCESQRQLQCMPHVLSLLCSDYQSFFKGEGGSK